MSHIILISYFLKWFKIRLHAKNEWNDSNYFWDLINILLLFLLLQLSPLLVIGDYFFKIF